MKDDCGHNSRIFEYRRKGGLSRVLRLETLIKVTTLNLNQIRLFTLKSILSGGRGNETVNKVNA